MQPNGQQPSPQPHPQPPVHQPPSAPVQPPIAPVVPPAPAQSEPPQQQTTGQQPAPSQPQGAQQSPDAQQQVVWMSRPHMPEAPDIPEEALKRHEESTRLYPSLNLSRGEFVISAIRRHPIGLLSIWFVSGLLVVMSFAMLLFIFVNQSTFLRIFDGGNTASLMVIFTVIFLLLAAIAVVGGMIATYVYWQNKFFLTNESVTQYIQISLFSRKEQTVSLSNIEDASYRKNGLLEHIFNYGSIRLSTQGDETTYRFNYVSNPKHQITLLNNAVEAFKMGRPVMHLDENR